MKIWFLWNSVSVFVLTFTVVVLSCFVLCGCVYVWVLYCVAVCMCWICNVWVCVCVGFVIGGCVYVLDL
jgi:hypothetical protein